MSEQTKGKDTLMKLLLSTPVASPMPSIQVSSPSSSVAGQLSGTPNSSSVPSPITDTCDDDCVKLTKYLHELAGQCGKEQSAVYTEHSYSRPSSWCPENTFVRPTRRLFMPERSTGGATKPAADEREAVLDVEGEVGGETPHDMSRVLTLMQECESAVSTARPDQNEDEDWEEKVPRSGWTPVQNRLFGKVARALHSDRLVRLAHSGAWNKPVLRRVAVDKTVRRVRQTLASVGWDLRLAQWLHITLSEHLTNSYLAIYLDVLQKLRAKAPQLVDRMVGGRVGSLGPDTVAGLLKRPWDPAAASLGQHKPRKLPGNPILVVVPSTPAGINMHSSRSQHWLSHLSALGQVATVNMHSGSQTGRLAITNCLDQMVAAIKAKIGEIRVNCPGRPLILIGWNTAACIASQVSLQEQVTAVVCLGFPMLTADGKRGEPNDTLLDMHAPTLFVIGQMATTARCEDIEDLRERMRVETGLVVVGSADDRLRVTKSRKMKDGVTQSMIDRCILDEIGDFLGSILMRPHPAPVRPVYTPPSPAPLQRTVVRGERVNKIPSTPSDTPESSEPSSPAAKRSRPGTPVNVSSSIVSTTASPSKPTLSTLSTLVSVSALNAGATGLRRKRLANLSSPQDKWGAHKSVSSRNTPAGMAQSGGEGITVNIGSLASLAPIGPIRLGPASPPLERPREIHKMGRGGTVTMHGLGEKSPAVYRPSRGRGRGRARGRGSSGLSSLLQGTNRVITTGDQQQIKGVPRTLDLSKLTVLTSSGTTVGGKSSVLGTTSSGSVVMLSDSMAQGGSSSSPMLMPLSSPITLLPRGVVGHHRSVTVIPNISAMGRLNVTSSQAKTTFPKVATYTVASSSFRRQTAMAADQSVMEVDTSDDNTLTPAKLLELPIIFAKDDDSFEGAESAPIVLPINSASKGDSSVVTTGDTISFPLDDKEDMGGLLKSGSGQNVLLIKSSGGGLEKGVAKSPQRILQRIGKVTAGQGGLKCAKIILNNSSSNQGFKLRTHLQSPGDLSIIRSRIELKKLEGLTKLVSAMPAEKDDG